MLLKNLLLALVLTLGAAPAYACLWDNDTLAQEAAGIEDEVSIIMGGFPRNPDKYYEIRLERAEAALKADAKDWNAYDDAGVASDRLGKSERAIAYMEAKDKALKEVNYAASEREQPTQIYRLKANQGTFYVHRWLKNGADFEKLEDVKKAQELIAAAIKENPDAHFGREIYQLKAIEWLLKVQEVKPTFDKYHSPESYYPDMMGLNTFVEAKYDDKEAIEKQNKELDAIMRGLTGLMQMGSAWRSMDVLYCMKSIAALQNKASLAIVIDERIKELSTDGLALMVSNTPTAEEAKAGIKRRWRMRDSHSMPRQDVKTLYAKARKEVDDWHQARTKYLEAGLAAGQHPDTTPDFWKEFKEGKPEGIKVDLGVKASSNDSSRRRGDSPANGGEPSEDDARGEPTDKLKDLHDEDRQQERKPLKKEKEAPVPPAENGPKQQEDKQDKPNAERIAGLEKRQKALEKALEEAQREDRRREKAPEEKTKGSPEPAKKDGPKEQSKDDAEKDEANRREALMRALQDAQRRAQEELRAKYARRR